MKPNWHFSLMAPFYDAVSGLMNRKGLEKLLEPEDGLRVLDAGGGTGLNRSLFPEVSFDSWTVLDINRNMIRWGTKQHSSCQFVLGSVLQMPFPGQLFDRVLIADALHHMPRPKRVLKESHRVLKPSGKLIVEEINPDSPIGALVESGEGLIGMGSTFYSPDSLKEFLDKEGFRLRELQMRQYMYTISASPS